MVNHSYGFCIPDNKYDSYIFRVKLNVNILDDITDFSEILPHPENEDDMLCAEEIRLKFDQLNLVLLGYLRTVFKGYFSHKTHFNESGLLLTKPKEIEFEIFIFKKYLGLMEFLRYFKEKRSTLE